MSVSFRYAPYPEIENINKYRPGDYHSPISMILLQMANTL